MEVYCHKCGGKFEPPTYGAPPEAADTCYDCWRRQRAKQGLPAELPRAKEPFEWWTVGCLGAGLFLLFMAGRILVLLFWR